MLTVAILINGNPIMARSAVNQKQSDEQGRTAYKTDAGQIIWHDPADGAVELAKKLLDTIVDVK